MNGVTVVIEVPPEAVAITVTVTVELLRRRVTTGDGGDDGE
jgi:hypothetical protein